MRTRAVVGPLLLLLVLGCGGTSGGGVGELTLSDHVTVSDISSTSFCCDPDTPFPQDIGSLTITNRDFAAGRLQVRVGPFSSGVIASTGPEFMLAVGESVTVTLQATDCGWATSEGSIVVDALDLLGPTAQFEKSYVLSNTCQRDRITAGLEVSGLARAYFRQDDPSPLGPDPVLYVVGKSDTAAVETYAIKTNPTTGKITNAPKIDSTLIGVPGAGDDDIVPVSAGVGPLPGQGRLTRALYLSSPLSSRRTHWNLTNFGGLLVLPGTKDMVSYGGNSRSTGVSYIRGTSAGFEEYDPSVNFFTGAPAPGTFLTGQVHFPGHVGDPSSVFVDEASGGAIIVMDGSPGQVWFHNRQDPNAEGELAGVAGNNPRQVRAKNGLAAISNYDSGTVTMMAWAGPIKPIPAGTLTFAGTPIANPLKMDMLDIDRGRTLLAVASDTTDSWWLGELDGSGNLLRSFSGKYGSTGGLADIVFIPGKTTYLAVAAKGHRDVLLIPTEFESAAQ